MEGYRTLLKTIVHGLQQRGRGKNKNYVVKNEINFKALSNWSIDREINGSL